MMQKRTAAKKIDAIKTYWNKKTDKTNVAQNDMFKRIIALLVNWSMRTSFLNKSL